MIKISGYTKRLLDGILQEYDFFTLEGDWTYDGLIGYLCTFFILESDKRKKKVVINRKESSDNPQTRNND